MKEQEIEIKEGAKTIVSAFRKGSSQLYSFTYSTVGESYTYGTNDAPQTSFQQAAERVESAAAEYLGIDDTQYDITLDSVSWNEHDNTIQLDLFYPENKVSYIKVRKSKIPNIEITDRATGLTDPSQPRNALNKALTMFRQECVRYIRGERKQQPLPFPEENAESEHELAFEERQ